MNYFRAMAQTIIFAIAGCAVARVVQQQLRQLNQELGACPRQWFDLYRSMKAATVRLKRASWLVWWPYPFKENEVCRRCGASNDKRALPHCFRCRVAISRLEQVYWESFDRAPMNKNSPTPFSLF